MKEFHKSVTDIIKENLYGIDILAYNTRRSRLLIMLYALMQGEIIEEENIKVCTADSLKCEWANKFDAVIGNPPYVKFQDLNNLTRNFLTTSYQTTRTGTYNLYFAFLN